MWAYEYQVQNIKCLKKPLHIHYINGIRTEGDEASKTIKDIGTKLRQEYRESVNSKKIKAIDLLHREAGGKKSSNI